VKWQQIARHSASHSVKLHHLIGRIGRKKVRGIGNLQWLDEELAGATTNSR